MIWQTILMGAVSCENGAHVTQGTANGRGYVGIPFACGSAFQSPLKDALFNPFPHVRFLRQHGRQNAASGQSCETQVLSTQVNFVYLQMLFKIRDTEKLPRAKLS